MLVQPYSVRHEFPLRATYSRQVLPLVVGFPHLRVLCLIRHPVGIRPSLACLRAPCSRTPPESTPFQGSSPQCVPTPAASSPHFAQEPFGASRVLRRIPSCMPRPDDSAGPSQPSPKRLLLYSLRCTLNSSASGTDLVEAVPALQGARSPAAYRMPCVRLPHLSLASYPAPH